MDDIGLAFTITADPSSAEAALDAFGGRARSASDSVNQSFGGINKTMLSNRESVRLLSEEMGIHLPRAVSGAVAEMLPAISSIGPVLLGAFAVMEIPKLVKGISDLVDSWEGFGKAEKKAMADAIRDTASLAKEVKSVENELDLFGKSMAEKAAMQAKWAGEDADRALQDLLKAESKVADLNAKVKEAKRGAGVFAAGAGGEYAKAIEAATAEVNAAREAWKLADEKAFLEQKKSAEAAAAATVKAAKDEAHAAKEAALSFAEWAKQQHAVFGTGRIMQQQVAIEAMAHGWDNAAISVKLYDDEQARFIQELPLAQSHLENMVQELPLVQSLLKNMAAELAPPTGIGYGGYAVSIAAHAAKVAVDGLMASMDSAGGKSSAFSNKMFQAANAMAAMAKQAQDAADKGETVDPAQQIAGMVQIAAAAILTYKERSILEAVYYAAKSAAAFASGDYWAGAEYALASGLFAEAAGTASKAASATGGASSATGGNQSIYTGAPGGGGGEKGAGGGSKGSTIIWQQTGPIGNCPTCMANFARTLAGVQNALVGSGQLKIVATTAITKGPTQT